MKTSQQPVRLLFSERARLLDELEGIRAHLETVEEHLTVAAYRGGATLTARTERRLEAMREAVSGLRATVDRAPIEGD